MTEFDSHSETTIYLVRHCQPVESVREEMIRPLTPKGKADAAQVTRCLWDKDIDAVYSSPYIRAIDTIRDFADKKGLPIQTDPAFREREMGEEWIEGEEWVLRNRNQWEDFNCPMSRGGESLRQVEARIRPAFDRALAAHPGGRIVIVGHGTAFSVLLHSLDASFGYPQMMKITVRNPWIIRLTMRGSVLVTRTEML